MTDMVHLVEQAKSGNPRAQSIIYARFRKRALAVCTSITHNKEISEELTDDAFLIAFSKLDTLNDPEKFGSWVVTISARLALRYLKCQPCDKPIPFSHIEGFDIPCSPHDPPLSLEELQAAVNLLPEGYRQVCSHGIASRSGSRPYLRIFTFCCPIAQSNASCHSLGCRNYFPVTPCSPQHI